MTVGLDGRVLLEEFPSGVSHSSRQLFRHLIQASPDWKFVLFVSGHNQDLLKQRTQEFRNLGNVRIFAVAWPNRILNGLLMIFGRPYLDKLVGGVDVWFAPNIGYMAVQTAPLVLLVHDTTFKTYAQLLKPYTRWWHRLIRPERLLDRAQHIITPSEHSRHSIGQEFSSALSKKISVIPFGPPQPVDSNPVLKQSMQDRFSLHAPFFLSLGTLEPRKNITTLISAWLPEWGNLVVAGAAGGDNLPTKAGVQLIGYVTEPEKWELLRMARGVIFPSLAEGFGLPVLEAFAVGTPVIAGAHTSLVEVGQDAVLWTQIHNQAAIGQAVQGLCTDDTLRQQLIDQGRKVLSGYSWEKSVAAVRQVLEQAQIRQ